MPPSPTGTGLKIFLIPYHLAQYHNLTDAKNPQMCYHLRSCVPKLVKRSECPLEKNNYIDHR